MLVIASPLLYKSCGHIKIQTKHLRQIKNAANAKMIQKKNVVQMVMNESKINEKKVVQSSGSPPVAYQEFLKGGPYNHNQICLKEIIFKCKKKKIFALNQFQISWFLYPK